MLDQSPTDHARDAKATNSILKALRRLESRGWHGMGMFNAIGGINTIIKEINAKPIRNNRRNHW